VPAFFMRENPISSSRKPACMKKTKTAATMTQVVSTAGATSLIVGDKAVLSLRLESGQGLSPDGPDCRNVPRARHCPGVQDLLPGFVRREKPPANCGILRNLRLLCHTAAPWAAREWEFL
jgi:hypothetical protein